MLKDVYAEYKSKKKRGSIPMEIPFLLTDVLLVQSIFVTSKYFMIAAHTLSIGSETKSSSLFVQEKIICKIKNCNKCAVAAVLKMFSHSYISCQQVL